jgi:hypothetical protein
MNLVQPFHIINSLSFHHQQSSPLMSSSRHVRSSSNAKKREASSYVTCSRYGVLQTVKSNKPHFCQCLRSSNLQTSVTNDRLVSSINQEDLHCDPMNDDLSEPEINHDFVHRHLSVESQSLLANSD